jgi:hypothetical protein
MSDFGRRRVGPGARFAALVVFVVALLCAALPTAATAGSFSSNGSEPSVSVPGNQSAGDQYVETLPTTRGPRAPGRNKHAHKLSRDITKKIHKLGGSDAAALKQLATSPALGAPDGAEGGDKGSDGNASPGKGSHAGDSRGGKRHGSAPAVPAAAINAVDGGEAGLGWLVLAILAITALALGAVGYQRRRDKSSAS